VTANSATASRTSGSNARAGSAPSFSLKATNPHPLNHQPPGAYQECGLDELLPLVDLVVEVGAQDSRLRLAHELELVDLRLRLALRIDGQMQLPLQLPVLPLQLQQLPGAATAAGVLTGGVLTGGVLIAAAVAAGVLTGGVLTARVAREAPGRHATAHATAHAVRAGPAAPAVVLRVVVQVVLLVLRVLRE